MSAESVSYTNGSFCNGFLKTYTNHSIPHATQESYEGKVQRVREALKRTLLPLACGCLNEYVYRLHSKSCENCLKALNRIEKLYHHIFLTETNPETILNTSKVRKPKFLQDPKQIQEAFSKANQLFIAYRDLCINAAIKEMPEYFVRILDLKRDDKEIIEKDFFTAAQRIKETTLDAEFATFHDISTDSFIHYFLGIPQGIEHSRTSWVLRDLKKLGFIEEVDS